MFQQNYTDGPFVIRNLLKMSFFPVPVAISPVPVAHSLGYRYFPVPVAHSLGYRYFPVPVAHSLGYRYFPVPVAHSLGYRYFPVPSVHADIHTGLQVWMINYEISKYGDPYDYIRSAINPVNTKYFPSSNLFRQICLNGAQKQIHDCNSFQCKIICVAVKKIDVSMTCT